MNESAQTNYFYDATLGQRYEYTVEENGEEFETAHIFNNKFNSDELYLDWLKSFQMKAKPNGEVDQKYAEATSTYFDNCIEKVENFEMEGDWKSRISSDEKVDSMANLLAVAIVVNPAKNKVRTGGTAETQTIYTETYWNGIKQENTVQQKHILTNLSREEWKKKYNRILQKRFKQEKIGGLRKKPNMIFVPQDEAIGQLYDEMMLETEGFIDNQIPLRFKVVVIHHIFDSKLDEKK